MNISSTLVKSRRQIRFAPFALALLCFLLPFAEVSCQGSKVVSLTGVQLAFGTKIQQSDPFTGRTKDQAISKEPLVLFALLCTLLAGVSTLSRSSSSHVPMGAGIAAFVLLLLAKSKMTDEALREGHGMMSIDFGPGLTAACVLLLLGAVMAALPCAYRDSRQLGDVVHRESKPEVHGA